MTTQTCLQAADILSGEGVEAEVVDLLSLSPLDEETLLESLARTHRMVVVDESNPRCSIARDVAAAISEKGFDNLDAHIGAVTAPHTPVPFSAALENEYIPTAARVVQRAKAILGLLEPAV
jgi:pyruvate dehydrogenase E1 component beta subunit